MNIRGSDVCLHIQLKINLFTFGENVVFDLLALMKPYNDWFSFQRHSHIQSYKDLIRGNATFTSIDNGVSKTLKSCTLWIKKGTITPSLVAKLKRAGLVNFRDVGSLAGINEERGAQ